MSGWIIKYFVNNKILEKLDDTTCEKLNNGKICGHVEFSG